MTPTKHNAWFSIDREGFAKLVAEQKAQAMAEVAFSNTFDQNAHQVVIKLEVLAGSTYSFQVIDDDPTGFSDLRHAYTVFAESAKKADATKRGRFNLGEKLLLSLCSQASIASTTGTVRFRDNGTRTETDDHTERGTAVVATIELTRKEVAEFERLAHLVLVPKGVHVTYNGQQLEARTPVSTIAAKGLDTVIGPELRPTKRNCKVELYEVAGGEKPHIFELGIPVVEVDGRYHVNVCQKVPLSMNRDNVPPAYLTRLRTLVLDETYRLLDPEDANSKWVKDALPQASSEAVREVVEKRFGRKAVAFDPTDLEANKRATAAGYHVVGGRALNSDEWAAVRRSGDNLLPRAGAVTPSPKVLHGSDADKTIPKAKWTAGQRRVVDYSERWVKAVMGFDADVMLVSDITTRHDAWYGARRLTFNVGCLGKAWFDHPDEEKVDALLIHELAHEVESDHLSDGYYAALCDIGARLKNHADLRL